MQTIYDWISLFGLHLTFCLGLLAFHADFTADIYSVVLNTDVNRSFDEVALGIGLALLPIFRLPVRLERPSQVFGYFLYLAAYIPFCTVGLQCISLPIASLLPFIFLCAASIASLFWMGTLGCPPIVRPGIPVGRLLIGIVVVSLVTIALAASTIGIDIQPLALANVYDLRAFRREQFAEGGPLLTVLAYLISPLNLVLGPALVRAGLEPGRRYLIFVGAIVTYASYQTSGQKDALGACFICILSFIVWGADRFGKFSVPTWRVVSTFLVFMVLVPLYDHWNDDPGRLLSQLTLGRLFVATGMLASYWVEHFSSNPLGYYAGNGLLGLLFGRENEYGMPLARVIGLVYGGNEENNANTNMWADGYAQAGYLGVVFASIVALAVFRLLDRLAIDRDLRLLMPLCFPLAVTLTNGPILGLIISNGLWVLLLIAYFLPRDTS